ncbi:MAG: acyltransferase [Hyphomicrobiaceae bacterium]
MAFNRLREHITGRARPHHSTSDNFWCRTRLSKAKIFKTLLNPRLLLDLINAQVRMGLRATVPLSVRLRGRIRVAGRGKVILGHAVFLLGTIVPIELVSEERARIVIGDQSFINYGTSISAHKEVIIGSRCKIGHYVFIMDNNQHDIMDRTRTPESYPVVLEDNVWIGAHAIILPGVRIGRNSVVGAGSVVKHDVPANCVVAGNPATIKRQLPGNTST